MRAEDTTGPIVHARKRAHRVAVRFATGEGVVHTLEGPVRVRRGDAIVTGIGGEQWPVAAEAFARRYAPVAGLRAGCDGTYLARPVEVRAQCMASPFAVSVGPGASTIQGRPGDWRLDYGDGEFGIVAAHIFDATYERID